jgi:N4-(beta-N-acetylglucosaminyl)-L-asparaginase
MQPIDRRSFLASAAGAAALAAATPAPAAATVRGAVFIAGWQWGVPASERAAQILAQGGSLLDAIEKGINRIEDDPAVDTVGYGGLPNAEGDVELDAGIMDGTTHRAGAVFNLHKIKNPISVARLLMERTTHTQIAGAGALAFAVEMGFKPMQLLTPQSLQKWLDWKKTPHHQSYWIGKTHDTIPMCGAHEGRVAAGCSTSGLAWKIPGRVADSPIVGAGYYADDDAGAAGATGNGDVMTNYCTSVSIVSYMRAGMHPQEACLNLMRLMAKTAPNIRDDQYCVIAMNPKGEAGGASMNAKYKLQYAVWRDGKASLLEAQPYLR